MAEQGTSTAKPEEWNIAVEGGAIAKLPEEQRRAIIIEPAPEYRIDAGSTNPEKNKTKLIITVQLPDGRKAQYYPNRTSARKIASLLDTDLSKEGMMKWLKHTIFWGKILDQNVMGQEKKVLYVTDAKLIL